MNLLTFTLMNIGGALLTTNQTFKLLTSRVFLML